LIFLTDQNGRLKNVSLVFISNSVTHIVTFLPYTYNFSFHFFLSICFARSIIANRALLFFLLLIAIIYFHMYFFLSIVKVSKPIVALILRRLLSITFTFLSIFALAVRLKRTTKDCSFKMSFFSFFLRLLDTEDSSLHSTCHRTTLFWVRFRLPLTFFSHLVLL